MQSITALIHVFIGFLLKKTLQAAAFAYILRSIFMFLMY